MSAPQILPGHGEGDHAKHGGGAFLPQMDRTSPSTTLRVVPLPRWGRIF